MIRSYKTAMILTFILVVTVPLFLLGIVMTTLTVRDLEQDAAARSLTLVQTVSAEIEVFLDYPQMVLQQIAMLFEHLTVFHESPITELFHILAEVNTRFDRILVVNQEGIIIYTTPGSEQLKGFSMRGQPFFYTARETGTIFWGSPFIDLKTMRMTLPVSLPFQHGVVVGYVNLELLRAITQRIYEGGRGFAFITDQTGVVIAHPDEQIVLHRTNQKYLDIVRYGLEGKSGTLIYEHHQERYIGSVTQVKKTSWSVVVTQPTIEAFALSRKVTQSFWIGCGLALVIALSLALWNSKKILRPLLSLAEHTQKVASGDYGFPFTFDFPYKELNALAHDFVRMAEAIQDRERRLLQDEGKIRNLNVELEKRVQQRTAELERTNRELQSFAHIVSHDLKAPLRGISKLAHWLVNDYAEAFDEDGKEMAHLLISRVKRMGDLIDGILQYSRAGRLEEKMEGIDLNTLVRDVVDMLVPPENIHIRIIDRLPIITGNTTQITQVFQNLLSNAVKYTDDLEGEISIHCVDEGGYWTFSVADNGPGIEPQDQERIFQMFQTLQPRDNVESTGIGLALVKKIVELYGGKIWVESVPGQGSTFFFTFPKKIA